MEDTELPDEIYENLSRVTLVIHFERMQACRRTKGDGERFYWGRVLSIGYTDLATLRKRA